MAARAVPARIGCQVVNGQEQRTEDITVTATWTLLSTEGSWEYWLREWDDGRDVFRRRVGNGYMFEGEPVGCRWESSWEHYLRFHTPGACYEVVA